MRIAVIGGGPGGLYFAALTQQLRLASQQQPHEITVWERNAADDTFGFGVVFSDETLGGIEHADPWVFSRMRQEFARWDDIDVHYRGQVITSGGHGFAAMSRRRLLQLLQERCRALGVSLHFSTLAPDVAELSESHDLVIAADGLNSAVRARYADRFRPTVDVRQCRYMWLGTEPGLRRLHSSTSARHRTASCRSTATHIDAEASTFIVEMNERRLAARRFRRLRRPALRAGRFRRKVDRD